MKKIVLIVITLVLVVISLQGAKKKKNINKYIFAGKNWLIVFDGETKTVQRRQFATNTMSAPLYFSKQKKILIRVNGYNLYSIDVNNLNTFYKVDLFKFNKSGKYSYTFNLEKKDSNSVIFTYGEGYPDPGGWGFISYESPTVTNMQNYLWNINNNNFIKVNESEWKNLSDDPYEARDLTTFFNMGTYINENKIERWKNWIANNQGLKNGNRKDKRDFRRMKRLYKNNKKFLKLLKKGKINVGSYNQISDLQVRPTGGRYMVVRNDKLYLVQMKTKEVYTLMDDPFRELNYFIIEKNEDDVDLDAE